MKKIKLLKLFLLCSMYNVLSYVSFAQGNLQFNQVKNIGTNASYGVNSGINWLTSPTFTVPSGKVWKVEGFYLNTVQAANTLNYITSSGSSIIETSLSSNLMGSNTNVLWLPPGTYAVKTFLNCGGSGSCTGTIYNTVNAIEFNVLP
jgi:hypothetical protein